jgi:hypothetical protein
MISLGLELSAKRGSGRDASKEGRYDACESTFRLQVIPTESIGATWLRVLETGEFERLGSPKTIQVDGRVIAAWPEEIPQLCWICLSQTRPTHLHFDLAVMDIRPA